LVFLGEIFIPWDPPFSPECEKNFFLGIKRYQQKQCQPWRLIEIEVISVWCREDLKVEKKRLWKKGYNTGKKITYYFRKQYFFVRIFPWWTCSVSTSKKLLSFLISQSARNLSKIKVQKRMDWWFCYLII
jgi:hypothetical protein